MSLNEVMEMSYSMFAEFSKYIPIISAQERLALNTVAAYPNLKNKKKKELHESLFKTAFPEELDEREVIQTDQMLLKLKRF